MRVWMVLCSITFSSKKNIFEDIIDEKANSWRYTWVSHKPTEFLFFIYSLISVKSRKLSLFFFRLITGLYWWINVIYYILLIIKLILFKKPACLKVCSHLAHIYRLRRRSRGIIITRIQAFTGIVYNPPFTMVLNFVPLNEGSNSKVAYNHQLYSCIHWKT